MTEGSRGTREEKEDQEIKTSEATGQVGVRQYDGLVALIETSADNI